MSKNINIKTHSVSNYFDELHYRVLDDQIDFIKKLKDINQKDQSGERLVEVVIEAFPELFQTVLNKDKQAILNFKAKNQITALMLAIQYKRKELVKLLLDNKVDVNAKDILGNTPLMYATKVEPWCFDLLIENGANPHLTDKDNMGLLTYACYNYNYYIAKKMLELGADVNERNNRGVSPLMAACADIKSKEIIPLLINYGAKFNLKTDTGQTALAIAKQNDMKIFEILKTFKQSKILNKKVQNTNKIKKVKIL